MSSESELMSSGSSDFCCRQPAGALPAAAGKLPVASCRNSAPPCPGLQTAAALVGADALKRAPVPVGPVPVHVPLEGEALPRVGFVLGGSWGRFRDFRTVIFFL